MSRASARSDRRGPLPRLLPAIAAAALLLAGLAAAGPPQQEKISPLLKRAAAGGDSLYIWVFLRGRDFSVESRAMALARRGREISPRALERRARRGTVRGIVVSDLPVSASHVEALRRSGLRVRRTSRWLNAVSGVAAPGDLGALAGLPFVAAIRPLGRGGRVLPVEAPIPLDPGAGGPVPAPSRTRPSAATGNFDAAFYGASWEQNLTLQVPALHEMGFSGAGVLVGIFDTGFAPDHRALRELTVIDQYDFVNDDAEVDNEAGDSVTSNRHGTYVWSAMAAYWPGTLVGPAYGASFLLAKTEDVTSETPVEEDNWIAAMEWMEARGVDVTNASLSYFDWYSYRNLDGDTAAITIAADAAVARGVVVVNSAGNEGGLPPPSDPDAVPIQYYVTPPADGDSVIAVGATDISGQRTGFSSHGPTFDGRIKPDVMAVGAAVASASPAASDTGLVLVSGTSLSSPLVAGAVALIVEAHPDWDPMRLLEALRSTADRSFNQPPGQPDNDYGWGYVRAADAVTGGGAPPVGRGELRFFNFPNPFRDTTTFSLTVPGAGSGRIRVYTPAGTLIWSSDRLEAPGAATLYRAWNGRNAGGIPVAPGVYLAVVEFGGIRATTQVLRIR